MFRNRISYQISRDLIGCLVECSEIVFRIKEKYPLITNEHSQCSDGPQVLLSLLATFEKIFLSVTSTDSALVSIMTDQDKKERAKEWYLQAKDAVSGEVNIINLKTAIALMRKAYKEHPKQKYSDRIKQLEVSLALILCRNVSIIQCINHSMYQLYHLFVGLPPRYGRGGIE